MPDTPYEAAVKLAKQTRSAGDNPLARRRNARFNINDQNDRESTLAATHDAYDGVFGNYDDPQPVVKSRPQEYLEQPGRISINLTRLFIDILSVSYDETPQRVYYRNGERVPEDDAILKVLAEQNKAADLDQFMGMVDRWMRLFGNVVIRPVWDEVNKQLVYQAYPSYCVRVVENAKNPRKPLATVLIGGVDGYNQQGVPETKFSAEIWHELTFTRLEDGAVKEGPINLTDAAYNYDFEPLVHCFDSLPYGGKGRYYVNAPGWSLAQQNHRLNEDGISQYLYATLMQAIGIMVVKGAVEGELVISPGRALHFPNADDASGLQSISQGAQLADFRDAIEFIIDQIRESNNIPRNLLTAESQSSGQAVIQANAPLAEMRRKRQPLFARIETDLLRASLQELRGRADGVPITLDPMEWDVAIMYADPQSNVSVTDQIAMDKHLLEVGVTTPADIAMREKPGQFDSAEEAAKWLAANKPPEPEEPEEPEDVDTPEGT